MVALLALPCHPGVRSLELDVHADPQGGPDAQSAGLRLAGQSGVLDVPALRQPGFKVGGGPVVAVGSQPAVEAFLLLPCRCVLGSAAWRASPNVRYLASYPLPANPPQVFHLNDFDYNSTCLLLTDCLAEVQRWSGGWAASFPFIYRY